MSNNWIKKLVVVTSIFFSVDEENPEIQGHKFLITLLKLLSRYYFLNHNPFKFSSKPVEMNRFMFETEHCSLFCPEVYLKELYFGKYLNFFTEKVQNRSKNYLYQQKDHF